MSTADDIDAQLQEAITAEIERFHTARREELDANDRAAEKRREIQREAVETLMRCGLNRTEIGEHLGYTGSYIGKILND